jgi:signal peptidase
MSSARIIWRVVKAAVLILVLGSVVVWAVLLFEGYHFLVMTTPSMSPVLPVHSLVVTAPTAQLHVGEIAAFRPPGWSQTFVHKVVAVAAGGYRTKGVLNSTPDPWTVPQSNVIGREVWTMPALGSVVQAAPVWIAIVAAVWGLSRLLDRRYRFAAAALATTICIEIPLAIWRPLVGMDIVSLIGQRGKARAFVVGTGVLPERFRLGVGRSVVVAPGHSAVLSSRMVGHLGIAYQATLPWWGWVLFVGASCLPLWVVVANVRPRPDRDVAEETDRQSRLDLIEPVRLQKKASPPSLTA